MSGFVEIGEYAIRHFAGDCDRPTAERALHMWEHYEDVTMGTRTAILARFPLPAERDPKPGLDFLPAEDCCEDCDDELDFAEWSAQLGTQPDPIWTEPDLGDPIVRREVAP